MRRSIIPVLVAAILAVTLSSAAAQESSIGRAPRPAAASRDPRVREAFAAYGRRNDGRALELFLAVAGDDSASNEDRAVAHYGAGMALLHQLPTPDYDKARRHFESVVKQYGKTAVASRAALGVPRSRELQAEREGNDTDAAVLKTLRQQYQGVVDAYPETDAATEALMRKGLTYVKSMTVEDARTALDIFNAWTARHGKHRYASAVYVLMGRLYLYPLAESITDAQAKADPEQAELQMDYYRKSLDAMLKAVEAGIETYSIRGDVYYRIADVAHYSAERPKVALAFYRRIVKEMPTDARAYLAEKRIKDLLADHPNLEQ